MLSLTYACSLEKPSVCLLVHPPFYECRRVEQHPEQDRQAAHGGEQLGGGVAMGGGGDDNGQGENPL